MVLQIVWIITSLVLLYFGADWLVKGGASLASRMGLTPLVVGLTVVAMGTSMPELTVSIRAALGGQSSLAVGNAVGSNIFNIGAILGIAALICPLKVKLQLLKMDLPWLLGISALFLLLFADRYLSRVEGAVFVVLLVAYTAWNVINARKQNLKGGCSDYEEEPIAVTKSVWIDLGLIILGVGVLIAGSNLLVENGVLLAQSLGMSEAVIGLTVIAAGTSMPELATSVVAAVKGKTDIAIGNIIGSNLFNIAAILGISSVITPIEALSVNWLDMGVMGFLTLLLLPLMKSGFKISRPEGAVLLTIYIAYTCYLIFSI